MYWGYSSIRIQRLLPAISKLLGFDICIWWMGGGIGTAIIWFVVRLEKNSKVNSWSTTVILCRQYVNSTRMINSFHTQLNEYLIAGN